MNGDYSDALVVFGITGDLAFKKILPALENLERRGRLPEIVVGVARGGVTRQALIARLRESLAQHGDGTDPEALRRLEARLQLVDGDYRDDATFVALRTGTGRRPASLPLPGHSAEPVRRRSPRSSAARVAQRTPVSSSRSRSGAISRARRRSTGRCNRSSTRSRSFASIISSARRPCRTCCTSASPTPSSSRSGTARTSSTCRSPWPRSSASRVVAGCTKNSARCGTSCRTTCCRCWRSWRWNRPSAPAPKRCATRR